MKNAKKSILLLALLTIISTLFVWLPFVFGLGEGMLTVFKNYDGPNYLIIAKCWYQKACIAQNFSLPTPLEYYPAHLPGYPLLIKIFNLFLPGPWAMLLVTTISTILAVITFYLLLKKFNLTSNPFWLSFLFLFLPARWLAVRSVGSPEPFFIFAILASFYFFKSRSFLLAGIFGALAQITKSPGILLFGGYLLYLFAEPLLSQKYSLKSHLNNLYHSTIKPAIPLFLIPVSAVLVFWFYQRQTGDFLAYFHSGDNFHLVFPPYQSFISGRSWLGQIWIEDIIWQYLVGALAVIYLIKQKHYDFASFAGVFFAATLFIAHRDLARYSLPVAPFALIAFEKFLTSRAFKIALLIILPAIYLYTINFIIGNTAPVADWTPYL